MCEKALDGIADCLFRERFRSILLLDFCFAEFLHIAFVSLLPFVRFAVDNHEARLAVLRHEDGLLALARQFTYIVQIGAKVADGPNLRYGQWHRFLLRTEEIIAYIYTQITYRAMMGEFIIYYRGKIVGGIYDDRLLVKPTKSAISYMPTVTYEIPYENAKEMLLVEEVDNKDFLTGLFDVMYDELPTPKPKKKK